MTIRHFGFALVVIASTLCAAMFFLTAALPTHIGRVLHDIGEGNFLVGLIIVSVLLALGVTTYPKWK